jgi:hypothetical protein
LLLQLALRSDEAFRFVYEVRASMPEDQAIAYRLIQVIRARTIAVAKIRRWRITLVGATLDAQPERRNA